MIIFVYIEFYAQRYELFILLANIYKQLTMLPHQNYN